MLLGAFFRCNLLIAVSLCPGSTLIIDRDTCPGAPCAYGDCFSSTLGADLEAKDQQQNKAGAQLVKASEEAWA